MKESAKELVFDLEKGKMEEKESEIEVEHVKVEEPKSVNLEEVAKLLEYAKSKGWI